MRRFETTTILEPAEVIARAKQFFALSGTPYTGFAEHSGEAFLQLRMEVGEIVVAARQDGAVTKVRASASRGDALLGRFMVLIGQPTDVRARETRRGEVVHQEVMQMPSPNETEAAPAIEASAEVAAAEPVPAVEVTIPVEANEPEPAVA